MGSTTRKELDRIRIEYARRDALGVSAVYQETDPAFLFHQQEREWALLKHLRSEGVQLFGCRVLEVGCGSGHILQRFLDFGAGRATGLDLMFGRLASGRMKHPRVGLAQGNAGELPFRAGQFDLVTQFMCLSSVLDPSLRRQIAAEMWRVLRPGGVLLSYDLRPIPFHGRVLLKLFSLLELTIASLVQPEEMTAGAPAPTPIQPLSLTELLGLFPSRDMHSHSVSLDFHLAGTARWSRTTASLLALVPGLRTHYLVSLRKPANIEGDQP
jgi:SAM-dependent methyltransferase